MSRFRTLLKNLGPGLLFASMAIGTSHLVLSTKAGATYGWLMVIPILLANLLKYPFFEYGIRYTNVTGRSLVEGYSRLGRGWMWLYAFITLVTTFTILAALYVVTAGLLANLFGISGVSVSLIALGLFAFISAALIIGRYSLLETTLKFVVTILFAALLVTTVMVLYKAPVEAVEGFRRPPLMDSVGVLFLISLIGWMPTAVEASSWISLWSLEKYKGKHGKPSLKDALQEFNTGYVTTALLAVFFLVIGHRTLYGTGTELSGNAVVFADQVVQLFTTHIGDWAYIFIAVSAFATMFSTCMTAHDAIARVSIDVLEYLRPKRRQFGKRWHYAMAILVLTGVNFLVLTAFGANMGNLVALATFISFVMAPLVGYMNLKNVTGGDMPATAKPGRVLRVLTYAGILFLSLFAAYYCWLLL
ncbi:MULTISPECIES: NRAMP family divalent metal transporter [unclassified Robiginitalea]|uniref:NRAMP family divalent metal transporter n=1 Tax=Robiginitalea TaxID=252306 RepID=UPI00234A6507|nr:MULTISPECIES: divalent metal cation transporter [unclassified Robiginitalea]MDC6354479.1 divalent metal cation transporter [Robiginitalea sp. PM2]MDC6374839.1 divalent metal cation transporter [Robiginitalea sp. SP8]